MIKHRLYIGTIGEGLFRSLDHGLSFSRAADGMFVECHVRALAVHPRQHQVLFLGSEHGLFRSDDGASNWRQVDSPINGKQVWAIVIAPDQPEMILVGTCPPAIHRSADGGASWAQAETNMRQECPRIYWNRLTTLKADPHHPQRFWAGVEIDGPHRSADGGKSFQPIGQGLSSQDIHDLAFSADGAIIAATNNDLNRSTDSGQTWQPVQVGAMLPWSYCRALCRLPGLPEVLLVGNGDGPPGSVGIVGRSTDGGYTWQAASMPRANSTIWNFAVHPADETLVYASSVSGHVYRSEDRGMRWTKLAREFGEIRALAWTPA